MTSNIIWTPSPNFDSRNGYSPEAIVIHIMAGTLTGTDSWFKSTESNASAHYGIGQNGEVHQYVREMDRAWHVGVVNQPSWKLYRNGVNPNFYTIGIEHEGGPDSIWSPEMKRASAELIRDIATRWTIPLDRNHVIGHYEIDAKRRPNCPAYDKGIIDELISMARSMTPAPGSENISELKKIIGRAGELLANM